MGKVRESMKEFQAGRVWLDEIEMPRQLQITRHTSLLNTVWDDPVCAQRSQLGLNFGFSCLLGLVGVQFVDFLRLRKPLGPVWSSWCLGLQGVLGRPAVISWKEKKVKIFSVLGPGFNEIMNFIAYLIRNSSVVFIFKFLSCISDSAHPAFKFVLIRRNVLWSPMLAICCLFFIFTFLLCVA